MVKKNGFYYYKLGNFGILGLRDAMRNISARVDIVNSSLWVYGVMKFEIC